MKLSLLNNGFLYLNSCILVPNNISKIVHMPQFYLHYHWINYNVVIQ